jgi:hypothetical protein
MLVAGISAFCERVYVLPVVEERVQNQIPQGRVQKTVTIV